MWVPLNVGNLPFGEVMEHARRLVWILEVNDKQTLPAMNMLRGEAPQVVARSISALLPIQTLICDKDGDQYHASHLRKNLRGKDNISTTRRDTHATDRLLNMYRKLLGHGVNKGRRGRPIVEQCRHFWKDCRHGVVVDMEC